MPSSTDDVRSLLNKGRSGTPATSRGDRNRRLDQMRRADDRSVPTPSRIRQGTRPGDLEEAGSPLPPIDLDDDAPASESVAPVVASAPAESPPVETQPVVTPAPAVIGARPASTLQKAWIDPEEMPFTPVPRPGNPLTSRLIAWLGVAAFLAGLGWLIIPEVNVRLTSLQTVQLGDGVLTAQPVQLAPLRPSIVNELYVDASSLPDGVLPEGTPIALLEGTSDDGTRRVANEIRTPFDARFVSVDTLVGGIVMPGTPVATLYDPTQMYVIVSVRPELLDVMRRGMRAQLVSEVAGVQIEGVVISAVPLLGTDHEPTTANLVNIRIKPDADAVADLVPGIRFDAIIDLQSAPPDAQPLVFTFAGHTDPAAPAADDGAAEAE